MSDPLLIAKTDPAQSSIDISIFPRMANRHGLIAGATGTGKTVTLQKIAESFSNIGVPVFMADVKGDLSGISQTGSANNQKVMDRVKLLGLDAPKFAACPVTFWDVFGEGGHPLRATISEMGPLLLARLLNLNDTQSGVLTLAFKVADDNGLLLLDLKDLRALLQYVGDNAKEFTTEYGNVSAASIGAIQRGLLALEQQGGESFFGEPALDLMDFIQTDGNGKGMINVLVADKLMMAPKLYGTFLLWLLSELWERLPEVGDVDKPKMLFFFDEAHLLFDDAPAALIDKIEQVVRLVRSKGVGVYFVTQNPLDVPVKVLAQLSNRVQHALRAFTPLDQKSVKVAAETFRPNPKLNVEEVITQLGVGEALISFLDEKGIPGIVEQAFVIPPFSQIGVITPDQRQSIIKDSVLFGHYEQMQDRDSAYEILKGKAEASAEAENATKEQKEADKQAAIAARQTEIARKQAEKADAAEHKAQEKAVAAEARRKKQEFGVDDVLKGVAQSATRAVGSSIGRSIVRGILGGLLGGSSSRSSSRKY